jgi:SAM-dependent methyltransferase
MSEIVSEADVDRFLAETRFSGYQTVPLPHGRRVPGQDRSRALDFFLSGIEGKTLLDIGTYYGMFPCEAIERGATRAVGIEPDSERYSIARRVAELNGSKYEIIQSGLEELPLEDRFDVVLFLNVLHHVDYPIQTVKRIADLSRDKVVVEFCLPWDPSYLEWLHRPVGNRAIRRGMAIARAAVVALACKHLPMMAVGNREYHRTFYFSPAAFENLFVLQHRVFSSVVFFPSPNSRYRAVALCTVAPGDSSDRGPPQEEARR